MKKQISKVEVKGLEARFYDELMDIITLGFYRKFINSALSKIELKDNFRIIDMGCGTGRNILILNKFAKKHKLNLFFYGIDKGETMLKKAMKKTKRFNNIKILNFDIRERLNFSFKFDAGLISFVLHGFIQNDRDKILNNFEKLIKKNGKLYILDYNELDVDEASVFVRFFFRKIECPLAEDFVSKNLNEMLLHHNFINENNFFYFKNVVRLAVFKKV